jgi:hypothetical protein
MKKSCDGCRAVSGKNCSLGYNTTVIFKDMKYVTIETVVPTEPCPKPKTYNDFLYQLNLKKP